LYSANHLLAVKLLFQGQFVEQKLMLSSNSRSYQIHNCQSYDFCHILVCYLSPTYV
jgi:hypothetical protein